MKPIVLKTEKVTLRQLTTDDAATYLSLLEKNKKHLGEFGPMTEAQYRSKKQVIESITKPENLKKVRFGVWKGKTLIGMVSFVSKGNKRCEIGGWIGVQYTRKGYALSALTGLISYAKTQGYIRIIATTYPMNHVSQNMLKKAGFTLVRRMKRRYYFAIANK